MALMDTPICDFGWKAKPFTLKDTQGNDHKLDDYLGKKGLLIAFICNHCPYVKAIIDRLVEDAKALQASDIEILAIMPNDYTAYPDDSPAQMKFFAKQHSFTFPYLIDEHQLVARAYDAVCTPDFFGFNAKGELQYRGRLDNLKMKTVGNRNAELLEAMQLVAETGKGPEEQVPSMGCSIKWT